MNYSSVTLGEIATLKYGKMPKHGSFSKNGAYPIYSGYDITGYTDNYNLSNPTLIIVARGNGVGQVKISPAKCWLTNLSISVELDESMALKEYLYYYFSGRRNLAWLNTGSAQPQITISDLEKLQVVVPDQLTQKRIVKILADLDAKIQCNHRINNILEKQGSLFVSNCLKHCEEKITLSEIMSFINGYTFSSKSYLDSGKYKIITIKNVQDGKIDSQGSSYIDQIPPNLKPDCQLKIGDVLISLTGNVGRVGIVCEEDLLLNQRVAKINPKTKEMLPFLYFLFRQNSMKQILESISKGTAQQNLSPVETLKLEINYNEANILTILPTLSSMLNKIIANHIENLRLAKLRDTLLPELINGKIDAYGL